MEQKEYLEPDTAEQVGRERWARDPALAAECWRKPDSPVVPQFEFPRSWRVPRKARCIEPPMLGASLDTPLLSILCNIFIRILLITKFNVLKQH